MELPAVEQVFDSLTDVIIYSFRQEQTSLLSLDRICQVVQSPNLFLNAKREGILPCSTIIRRRISSTLSSSDVFVRAGPPRTCLWAIRPNNPLFLNDGVISASVEQMLTSNGPMTLEQFVQTTQLNGVDIHHFERFLVEHANEFTKQSDSTYWFTGQPRPVQRDFESICHALAFALSVFPDGASVEELTWYLCLSTVSTFKTITRRNVSRELSRRTDIFNHLERARYTLIENRPITEPPESDLGQTAEPPPPADVLFSGAQPNPLPPPPQPPVPGDDEEFDPFSFFGRDFQFSFE
jgi:hypothetical protein